MLGGYIKKILFVDLTKRKISVEDLEQDFLRNFLGGYGIGAKIIYERQSAGIDPLSEYSIFGVLAGPITGTSLPSTSRYTVVGKSPLTNTWGDSNGGGFFGPALKFSGYDGIFFTGISDEPVYLLIGGDEQKICDAKELWGEDTYATDNILKARHGRRSEILCIGPSGEKLSLLSGVVTCKGKVAGRSGLGAIMGSKRLKAIVAVGGGEVQVANKELVDILRKKYINQIKSGVGDAKIYTETGTPGYVRTAILIGDAPVKNWFGTRKDFENIDEFKYENIKKYITRRNTCYKCPIACWGHIIIKNGPYMLKEESHIPEYQTSSAFGSYCLNNNYESIIKCNDLCNRYGIDTISTGSTIAFAINCYEERVITNKDTDGIELTWGNHNAIVKMTEKIVKREGFGDTLADGVKKAAERIGNGSEKYSIHIGGQELPAHDPRFEPSMASIYKNNATPGRHTQDTEYHPPAELKELMPNIDFSFSFGKKRNIFKGRAKAQKVLSALSHCVNSTGLCQFGFLSTEATFMPECYFAVTGLRVDLDEFVEIGERIGDLRLAFTIREGINLVKLRFPDIVLGKPPLKYGPTKGITVDLDIITKEFYKEMDWDFETCRPSKSKLTELGLDWLIKDLWGNK